MLRRWALITATLLIALGGGVWVLLQGSFDASQRETSAGSPALRFTGHGGEQETVRLTGLSPSQLATAGSRDQEGWRRVFPVFTQGQRLRATPEGPTLEAIRPRIAMLGTYAVVGKEIHFHPRFPFEPGLAYGARWTGDPGSPVELQFTLPKVAVEPSTRVEGIFPSGDVLPSNLLRLYVQFSHPMSRGEAERHLHLLEADGSLVPEPFVQMPQELWNPSTDRLTVLLDPGRVKRDVRPNLEVGAPLVEGRKYRLVVDAAWPDAQGAPLLEGHERLFRVGPADRSSPDPSTWRVQLADPPPESRWQNPSVTATLGEVVDMAMGRRLIWLETAAGAPVPGMVELHQQETRWAFHPEAALPPGSYVVVVAPELEDPSGNSLRRSFETPTGVEPGATTGRGEPFRLHFTVPPGAAPTGS